MSPLNISSQSSGNAIEEEEERVWEPEGMEDIKKTMPSKSTWTTSKEANF